MRLLLTTLNAKYIHINLAIRLLYELYHEEYPGLAWSEFTIKEDPERIAQACAGYQVVAFSCYIWNIVPTLAAARSIKALNPKTKILLGGPEVSYEWQDIIERPEVDYVIVGEGEVPFGAFLRDYPDLEQVPSLVRKDEAGNVHYNPKTEAFDLSVYARLQPYRHDAPESLRHRVLYLETSRGCPYKCEFCLASLDNKMRYLPLPSIKNLLLYLMEHGKTIKFLDRTFNIKRDFALDLFRFIVENHRPGNVFQFEITADILHPDILEYIQTQVPPGLFRFEIGIQTVHKATNMEVSRRQNFDKTRSMILALGDRVELHLDLIVGLPLDRWEDVRYSFDRVFELFAPELQLGFLKFLKGTPMRAEKHERHGFRYDPLPPYQIIESNYLSRTELERIERLEQALEIYWNKKRAPNCLRYAAERYGGFDFLLGLGEHFGKRSDYHRHSLEDVYILLGEYLQSRYPDDAVAAQMAALDYYLHYKTRPKAAFWIQEAAPRSGQSPQNGNLRSLRLKLNFDYALWQSQKRLVLLPEHSPQTVELRYDGTRSPELVSVEEAVEVSERK